VPFGGKLDRFEGLLALFDAVDLRSEIDVIVLIERVVVPDPSSRVLAVLILLFISSYMLSILAKLVSTSNASKEKILCGVGLMRIGDVARRDEVIGSFVDAVEAGCFWESDVIVLSKRVGQSTPSSEPLRMLIFFFIAKYCFSIPASFRGSGGNILGRVGLMRVGEVSERSGNAKFWVEAFGCDDSFSFIDEEGMFS
jgi:hypothetical protein